MRREREEEEEVVTKAITNNNTFQAGLPCLAWRGLTCMVDAVAVVFENGSDHNINSSF